MKLYLYVVMVPRPKIQRYVFKWPTNQITARTHFIHTLISGDQPTLAAMKRKWINKQIRVKLKSYLFITIYIYISI